MGRWCAAGALFTLEAAGRRGNPDRIRREDPPPLLADLDCAVPDLIRCSASARALSSQSVHPATGACAMDQRPHAQDLRPTAQRARPSAAKRSIARTAICQTASALGGGYCDGPRGRRRDRGDRERRDVRRHWGGRRWRCPHSRQTRGQLTGNRGIGNIVSQRAAPGPAVATRRRGRRSVLIAGLSSDRSGAEERADRLAERLAGETLQLVAIDLRGRGRSEVTGAGTYGWRNHARDVLGIADAVGAPSFAIIGQSSGAVIAMTCAQLEPSRVERLVLVDLAGSPDERAAVPVVASVSRLGAVYPSEQAAIALIKQIGIVPEWDEYWDRYFGYELRDVDGGVTARSDRGAVLEDLGYGNAMYWSDPEAPIHALWNAITVDRKSTR